MKNNKNNIDSTLKIATWILIVGIILVITSPYVLTANALFKGVSFTNTGQVGDTIGGITAPFANLLGAVLVFLALKSQVQANELIQVK